MEREEAQKKRSRSLSVPSSDLVGGPNLSLEEWGALHGQQVRQDRDGGSTLAQSSNRFSTGLSDFSLARRVTTWGA